MLFLSWRWFSYSLTDENCMSQSKFRCHLVGDTLQSVQLELIILSFYFIVKSLPLSLIACIWFLTVDELFEDRGSSSFVSVILLLWYLAKGLSHMNAP